MTIIRTIVWAVLLAALLIFSFANIEPWITVKIWPGKLLDTKIPAIVIVSFLVGFVPLWLWHRGRSWHYNRRIRTLESQVRPAPEATLVTPEATPNLAPAPAPATVAPEPVESEDLRPSRPDDTVPRA